MNIYKITFTACDYDEYDSFVVAALNDEEAVELIENDIPRHEKVESIENIGISNSEHPLIILGSFNAG